MKLLYGSVIALYVSVVTVFFYAGYYDRHLKLPEGYDEFGYLHMAKATARGVHFGSHADRPFDRELIAYLKKSSFPFESYAYTICPHAYHLKKNKVINQYPPGTGIILSLLPFKTRKTSSPALFAFIIMLFLLPAFMIKRGTLSFTALNMVVLMMFAVFLSGCFNRSFPTFSTVNSLAPTFGMLFAAGYVLDKRPMLSFVLLGTSSIFRIANALLFLPFLAIYLHKDGLRVKDYCSFHNLMKSLKALGGMFVGGTGIYVLYTWILIGSPFSTTYPDFDGRFALWRDIPVNIAYYIGTRWFLLHVTVLAAVAIMGMIRIIPRKWVVFSFSAAAYNYSFYFVHMVREGYYAYATGVVIVGIMVNFAEDYIDNKAGRKKTIITAGSAAIVAMALFSIMKYPQQDVHRIMREQVQAYEKCFSDYDVIWAGNRGGTVEYASGNAAFRFDFGTPGMRKQIPSWGPKNHRKNIMQWLHGRGYRQAIWVSDLENTNTALQSRVEKELQEISLSYKVKMSPSLGTIIDIP
jgi:hypothetical protein